MARTPLLVVASLLLAGCVVADAGPEDAPPNPEPEVPTGDEATLSGLVTDDQLQPLADVDVAVIDVDPILSARTDAAGRFSIAHVPPGPHKLAAQKLGYEAAARNVEAVAGQTIELNIALAPLPVRDLVRHVTLIGDGYFACGADTPVVTWGNLHACVWDQHKPRFPFTVEKADLMGILLEVSWRQSTALTSRTLQVYLAYKQVCDPFCDAEQSWGQEVSTSPVRSYVDMEKEIKKVKEDPGPLESITFPDRGDDPVVIVFQQRMTHYVSIFWGDHCVQGGEGDDCPREAFTAIPDT